MIQALTIQSIPFRVAGWRLRSAMGMIDKVVVSASVVLVSVVVAVFPEVNGSFQRNRVAKDIESEIRLRNSTEMMKSPRCCWLAPLMVGTSSLGDWGEIWRHTGKREGKNNTMLEKNEAGPTIAPECRSLSSWAGADAGENKKRTRINENGRG